MKAFALLVAVGCLALLPGQVRAEQTATTPVPAAPVPIAEAPTDEASVWLGSAGWFRVDTDALGTQLWLGATHDFGSVAIASDIYVVGTFAELDIGPSLSFGDLSLLPMIGLGVDVGKGEVASLIAPQLFSIYATDRLHFESWIQVFFSSPFDDAASDLAYTRNFILFEPRPGIGIGPQVELTVRIDEDEGVASLPVGGRINLGYGEGNTLGLFVGYETQAAEGAGKLGGRATFIRSW